MDADITSVSSVLDDHARMPWGSMCGPFMVADRSDALPWCSPPERWISPKYWICLRLECKCGSAGFVFFVASILYDSMLVVRVCWHYKKLRKVSCGFRHSALVTARGLVLTLGYGETGRLGHGNEEDVLHPQVREQEARASTRLTTQNPTRWSCGISTLTCCPDRNCALHANNRW